MSASMLGSLSCSYAGVCCWLLVVALLPAQGLCTSQHSQVQPEVCLTASTHANKHAYVHTCTSRFTTRLVSSRCLRAVLNTAVCRVCAACHHSQVLQHLFDGSNHRNRHTSMPDRCATRAVQLHLLAAISWFCVVSGCTGFVQHAVFQPGTGSMVCV
jgi:hypothetical protein